VVAGTKYSIVLDITNDADACSRETVVVVDDFIRNKMVLLGTPQISPDGCGNSTD